VQEEPNSRDVTRIFHSIAVTLLEASSRQMSRRSWTCALDDRCVSNRANTYASQRTSSLLQLPGRSPLRPTWVNLSVLNIRCECEQPKPRPHARGSSRLVLLIDIPHQTGPFARQNQTIDNIRILELQPRRKPFITLGYLIPRLVTWLRKSLNARRCSLSCSRIIESNCSRVMVPTF
jgi:hypothetical protein